MDLRPANLGVRDGRIEAIIDVANCTVGDPLLELARIRRHGLFGEEFLGGYGLDVCEPGPDELTLLDIYELDTAALLTVVAAEELTELCGAVPCRVSVLLDGEEEIGSPHLAEIIDRNDLNSDDFPRHLIGGLASH